MHRIDIKPMEELRQQVEEVLSRQTPKLQPLAPGVTIEHIGSTAIPGTVTKGDVDVVLRVPAGKFASLVTALRTGYEIAQPQNWTADFASFKDDETGPLPFGVQVIVLGSENDHLVALRDLLRRDPLARARYNEVKQRHHGSEAETYWQAKDRVINTLLAQLLHSDPPAHEPPPAPAQRPTET